MKVEEARVQLLVNLRQLEKPISPILTQTLSIEAFSPLTQRYVYMPFHFLPGNNPAKMEAVTPNSTNVLGLVNMAIHERNIYGLGIAIHTYADTWSHQGFTAFEEPFNEVVNWKTAYRHIVPNIGHADIGDLCDTVEESWYDYRSPKGKRKVVNKDRFYDALKHCYIALKQAYVGKLISPAMNTADGWDKESPMWKEWLNIEDSTDRCEMINAPITYWSDDPSFMKEGYEQFQTAAKKHVATAISNINF